MDHTFKGIQKKEAMLEKELLLTKIDLLLVILKFLKPQGSRPLLESFSHIPKS